MLTQYLQTLLNGGAEVEDPAKRLAEGLAAYKAGETEAACGHLEAVLAAQPHQREALLTLGQLHLAAGRLDDAEGYLRRALAVDSQNPALHYSLGELHQARKQAVPAEGAFRRATELSPKLTDAHVKLGMILMEASRTDEALPAFERAIFLDAHAVVPRFYLAQICIARQEYARAICQLHWLRRLQPNYAPIYVLRSEIFERQKDYRQVVVELERLVTMECATPGVYMRMGKAKLALKQDEEALATFKKAVELDPQFWQGHYAVAQVLEHLGRLSQALKIFTLLTKVPSFQKPAGEAVKRISQELARIAERMEGAA